MTENFKDTLTVKMYQAPYYGRVEYIQMSNIEQEDISFFKNHDIMVSIEEVLGEIIVYGCPASDDSEESEIMVIANSRSCQDTMKELREKCEKAFILGSV